jgi:hypothetical protein
MREGRAGERADEQAHSLSLSNACNPYYEHTPLARDNTSRVFPLCSFSHQPIWARTRSDKFTRRSRDPRGRNADTCIIPKFRSWKPNKPLLSASIGKTHEERLKTLVNVFVGDLFSNAKS